MQADLLSSANIAATIMGNGRFIHPAIADKLKVAECRPAPRDEKPRNLILDNGEVIERAFKALETGDLEAARRCFTPRATIWHCFDGVANNLDNTMRDWEKLVASFPERGIDDVRRDRIDRGFLQRHLFIVRSASGERRAWPVCIVVRIEDDRIDRIDEYIDRAGSFIVPEGPLRSPGL
jgi:ketosteroid isomerase-like protein